MTLPAPVRSAVLKVVEHLRDPMREAHVDKVGFMVLDAMFGLGPGAKGMALHDLRLALGLPPVPGSLARWASGKSREEVAKALEAVATSEAEER